MVDHHEGRGPDLAGRTAVVCQGCAGHAGQADQRPDQLALPVGHPWPGQHAAATGGAVERVPACDLVLHRLAPHVPDPVRTDRAGGDRRAAWSERLGPSVLELRTFRTNAHHSSGVHGRQSTRGIIAPDQEHHPILRGIKSGDIWGPTDVYEVRLPLARDCQPLVLGQILEGMHSTDKPIAASPKVIRREP